MNTYFEIFMKKRGYTKSFLEKINHNYNNVLKDMDKFVELLHDSKNIVIISDVDTDGISSGVILFTALKMFNFTVGLYDLSVDHYGFTKDDIDKIVNSGSNVDTIITADVGITQIEEIAYAKSKGLKVLVTDHHIQQELSEADVTINPNRLDETYPLKGICGSTVAYYCMRAYAEKYRSNLVNDIDFLQVFAGLGTIADVMPLENNNRHIVRFFIKTLRDRNLTNNPDINKTLTGMYHLLDFLKLKGKWKINDDIDTEFVGFYLVPLFNAIRRMGVSCKVAYSLFLNDKNREQIVNKLFDLNEMRKTEVENSMKALAYEAQIYEPYIYFSNARPTLMGLVANKIMSGTGFPTFVVNSETLSGSGRTPFYFPAQTVLRPLGFHLAGHENAFGIAFDSRTQLGDLYRFLEAHLIDYTKGVVDKPFDINEASDLVITRDNFNYDELLEFFFMLNDLKPFGQGFDSPKIAFKVTSDMDIQELSGGKHFKVKMGNFSIICFNQKFEDGYIIGNLGLNTFNGYTTLQMIGELI